MDISTLKDISKLLQIMKVTRSGFQFEVRHIKQSLNITGGLQAEDINRKYDMYFLVLHTCRIYLVTWPQPWQLSARVWRPGSVSACWGRPEIATLVSAEIQVHILVSYFHTPFFPAWAGLSSAVGTLAQNLKWVKLGKSREIKSYHWT